MNLSNIPTVVTTVIFTLTLSGCAPPVMESKAPSSATVVVSDFVQLPKLDGTGSVQITGDRSRPAMLYFTAMWTDSSDAAVEWLTSFPQDTLDVIPVFVDRNLSPEDKAAAIQRLAGLSPVMADEETLGAFGKIRVLPTALLVGVDGRIRNKWEGYTPVSVVLADMLDPKLPGSPR